MVQQDVRELRKLLTERAREIGASPSPVGLALKRLLDIGGAILALLVALTVHISTDVAAAPFLWVIPLALFLLTFVITFARRPLIPHSFMLLVQPIFVLVLAINLMGDGLRDVTAPEGRS